MVYVQRCSLTVRHMYIHALCLEYRVSWVRVPPEAAHFFLGKVTALGVLCYFALFVCLTLLASFFLPSHLSFKNMYIPQSVLLTHCPTCTIILMRDAEGRKKEASKVVQTSKQHNTLKAATFPKKEMPRVGFIKPTYTHTSQCREGHSV